MAVEFFQTVMGRRYYESSLPRQIDAMERLAIAIEKQNTLKEKELEKSN